MFRYLMIVLNAAMQKTLLFLEIGANVSPRQTKLLLREVRRKLHKNILKSIDSKNVQMISG